MGHKATNLMIFDWQSFDQKEMSLVGGKGARKTSVGNKELRSFTLNNLEGRRAGERVKDAETRIPSSWKADRFHIGFLQNHFPF